MSALFRLVGACALVAGASAGGRDSVMLVQTSAKGLPTVEAVLAKPRGVISDQIRDLQARMADMEQKSNETLASKSDETFTPLTVDGLKDSGAVPELRGKARLRPNGSSTVSIPFLEDFKHFAPYHARIFTEPSLASPEANYLNEATDEEGIEHFPFTELASPWTPVTARTAWVMKFPRSYVEPVRAMNHIKVHQFTFFGNIYNNPRQHNARKWVVNFASHKFGPKDFMNIGDATKAATWQPPETLPTGAWDHSVGRDSFGGPSNFDDQYWLAMTQSKFVLAPAGDSDFSYRFYEAIMAGAIPIVEKREHTWKWEGEEVSKKLHWKFHVLSDDPDHAYEYDQSWVEHNSAVFMRYCTYITGNHGKEIGDRTR